MSNIFYQPRGFSVFFLTEMCERYGFYIVQTLLVLYLVEHFYLSDRESYSILGSFTALAYINPIVGGYIADKILGAKRSIILGAMVMALGYVILALDLQLVQLFIGLGIIAVGTGLLKPNISSLLGNLYECGDPRRYAGYTLFYVGINIGIILATGLGGYLHELVGWPLTYFIAALVLLLAGIIFCIGIARYPIPERRVLYLRKWHYLQAVMWITITIAVNILILKQEGLADLAFALVAIISFLTVIYAGLTATPAIRAKLWAYLLLILVSMLFWALYFQIFLSMNLFIDRVVDRHLFGFELPVSAFVSIEALSLIVLGPILSMLWRYQEQRRRGFSVPFKFAAGMSMLALAFALLWLSSYSINAAGQVLVGSLIWVYVSVALGELMLSPTGLAMVTELVPDNLLGLMMGIFFVSLGLGAKLAGTIANCAAISNRVNDLSAIISIYQHAFRLYFMIGGSVALLSLLLIKPIRNLIGTTR